MASLSAKQFSFVPERLRSSSGAVSHSDRSLPRHHQPSLPFVGGLAPALLFTRALGHEERYLDGSALDLTDLLKPDCGFPSCQPMLIGLEGIVDGLISRLA